MLPHTADLVIHASGSTRRELLRALIEGMFTAAGPRPTEESVDEGPPEAVERPFGLRSVGFDSLLVDILNEAVFSAASYHEAYSDINFSSLTDTTADGALLGRPVGGFATEIKAATHHDLKVSRGPDGLYEVTVTFDV